VRRVDLFRHDRVLGRVNRVGLPVEVNRLHEGIGVGPSQLFETSTRCLSKREAPHRPDGALSLIFDPTADKSLRRLGHRHAWQDTHNAQSYRAHSARCPCQGRTLRDEIVDVVIGGALFGKGGKLPGPERSEAEQILQPESKVNFRRRGPVRAPSRAR